MGATGRTWAAIADFSKIIFPLGTTDLRMLKRRHIFRQTCCFRWDIIVNPVNPRASGSIRIITNQHKALCAGRKSVPSQRRRDIGPVTGVLFWYHFTIFKCRAL